MLTVYCQPDGIALRGVSVHAMLMLRENTLNTALRWQAEKRIGSFLVGGVVVYPSPLSCQLHAATTLVADSSIQRMVTGYMRLHAAYEVPCVVVLVKHQWVGW